MSGVAATVLLLLWAWALTGVRAEPAPRQGAQASSPTRIPRAGAGGDLVGADVCAECHEEAHEAWSAARHSRMIQRASRASVVGDFRQAELRLHGDPFRFREADGGFYITESRWSGAPVEHKVELTLGSRRIQHYLTTVDHGRIVVLPPAWDVERKAWFDSVEIIRPDEGDTQVVQQWNKNCVGCHVSEQDNRYDPATRTYATTWRDEGTTCERCHGPGREHVERYRAATGPAPPGATGIVRPTRLTPPRSTAVCAQCHSLRDRAAPGFRAGEAYDDYFVLKLEYTPRKEQDPVYWADGRPRRFSNDAAGLWQSQCYLRGGATCVTCHDGHAPNVDRHEELAPANTALCTRCHEAIGRDVAGHTKHAAASAGSACVECHMPREVVSIKARIRDHTIGVPTPENTVKYGIPNACTTCHTTESAAWAVARMAAWWPEGRRRRNVARAAAFTEGREARPDALPKLVAIAADPAEGPLSRANALGYLRAYDDPRAVAALGHALASEEPLLRMVAASSVTQPALQPALLRALGDSSRSVRLAALVSLVNLGTPLATPGDTVRFRSVSGEFAAQAAEHEDDAATQTDLGLVHLLNGRLEPASAALSIAMDLSPKFPGAAFFLGLVRMGQHRAEDARRLLARVPAADPFYAMARARLKQLEGQERR